MTEAETIGTSAIDKLNAKAKEEGKPLDKYRVDRMLAALKTHADARRYDQAEKIATDFKKELATKGYTAAYTDPIERPPVPGYRKIDADQTISDNKDAAGFNEGIEQWVRKYVAVSNAARQSPSHIQAIYKADDVHKHIAEACSA